ncbi:MAG: hypothetical protein KAR79_05230 [Simkaniaceae bacterium]|nr:hypothetical protein [Simkaniaceae bacterium]
MIKKHAFIFKPGVWLGEGKIKLSMVQEKLSFHTKWKIMPQDDTGYIECLQEIHISGISDVMINQFILYDILQKDFCIELENQTMGKVVGKGLLNPQRIAWEFRLGHLGFEGFECYELQEDETYLMHAEYATNDDFRTEIHGKIWKKTEE